MKNLVTVVFDGHPDHFQAPPQGDIRVIFSDGCSADDKIKLMVEDYFYRKNCVVVTDDKDIFLYARSLGARVMKVAAFTAVRVPRSSAQTRGQETDGKYISLSRQEKINKELRFFWLKEK